MKLKSLLFGSAAVIAAGTGAQAADLPVVEPVEYVRICDAFGSGFYYLPGTDTCLRVSGQVRVQASYSDGFDSEDTEAFFTGVDNDADDLPAFIAASDYNNFNTRARGNMRLDARTQTDFGLIRAFIDFQMEVDGDSASATNNDGTDASLSAAFIQISNDMGTFTAGHSGSNYDFFGGYGYSFALDVDDNTTEQTQFAYTFAGGNGFSATIAVEDPASSGRRKEEVDPFVIFRPDFQDDYEGQETPDLVGNIRVDQGWGAAQVMGVLHPIHDLGIGDDNYEIGYAVGAGLSLNLPFGGIEFSAQGGYSEGAIGYLTTDIGGVGDFSNDEELNEAWHVRAGLQGGFTETTSAWVSGSYTEVDENEAVAINDDDYTFWAVKGGVQWEPVSGLTMGPQITYNNIEFDEPGRARDRSGEDFEAYEALFQVQRAF